MDGGPSLIEAAVAYTSRGWFIFPCHPRDKRPLTTHGVHDSSNDPVHVRAWWTEWPDANIGLDVYRSGQIVVDLDPARGGREAWAAVCGESVLTTLQAATGSGGDHFFFEAPLGIVIRNSSDKLGPGIDVRGRGGYVILAPSIHPKTGHAYAWVNDLPPAPFPAALIERLTPPPRVALPPTNGHADDGYYRCLAYLRRLPDAVSGSGGHNATFHAACEIWRFGLTDSEARDALDWFNAHKCRPVWSEGELRHKLESAYVTVSDAGEIGARLAAPSYGHTQRLDEIGDVFMPAPVATDRAPAPGSTAGPTSAMSGAAVPPPDPAGKPPLIKDTQLRDRYLRKHRTTAYGLGNWYRYDRGVYARVPEAVVGQEVQEIIDQAEREDVRLRPTWWQQRGVTGLVQSAVTVPDDRWNRDPDILVCRNGTLTISDRRLRPHAPLDYVTSGVDYDYDPAARAETWEQFLDQVLAESRQFIQEFIGLCLTTTTDYEVAVWLYGPPGGGKSTFVDGVKAMLGDRCGVLGLSDIEQSPFMLQTLIGRTLVTATENPNDFPVALGKVNQIISGEPITVNLKYKAPIEVVPQAKILWAMNDLPRVTDANNGIFRRVKVIHVPALPESQRDPAVKRAIKSEGAGILNWALDGLERLRSRGHFDVPAAVEAETVEFKSSNDVESTFVAEECHRYPSAQTKSSRLYEAYFKWCKANGHGPKSSTRVSTEWERLGFKKTKAKDGNYWSGVQLVEHDLFTGS